MSPLLLKTYRGLVVVYVVTFFTLLIANIPRVGGALIRLQQSVPGLSILTGLMGALTALTFFLLLGHCLYHWGTHPPENFNKAGWFLVIVLLNFIGVVIYYLRVIEREQRAAV